jgi:hypothetical protein
MTEIHPIRQVAASAYSQYVKSGRNQLTAERVFDIAEGYALENPSSTIPEAIHEVYLLLMAED